MRVFLLILIALIVGSAAGSMSSWFLLKEPQPLAVATANTAVPGSSAPLATPLTEQEREAREAIERETALRSKTDGSAGILEQQARQTKSMQSQVQDAPAVTAPAEPPTVEKATNAAPNGRPPVPADRAVAPVEQPKDGPNYVLPIGIGLIAAIVAFLVANRVVSQDI